MNVQTLHYSEASGFSTPIGQPLDSARTLVLVFASPEFARHPAPLDTITAAYPNSVVVGCSTAGEIVGTRLADHSLSIAIVRFDRTDLALASAEVRHSEDSYEAALSIARQLKRPDLRGILVLSDGLNINGSELARGFRTALPSDVSVTGGLAGDGSRFSQTWVLSRGRTGERIVVAVGFYGDHVQIGHGSQGGWDIFGPERLVTRSENNVLYELDGKPALELYKRYLGDRANALPAAALLFPLALRTSEHDTEPIVRTILAVDESQQSMTFAGEIPEGSRARLMHANLDRLVQGASHAATGGARMATDESTLAIAISCVGRRLVLGERTEEEIEATLDALPDGSHQVGFYSYGELCPQNGASCCELHNQTMTITTISERN
jgi:hypothetical protein